MLENKKMYENIKPENCIVNENGDLVLIDFDPSSPCGEHVRALEVFY